MSTNIDTLIAKAKELARKDDNQGAMLLANELIGKYPNEVRVWSLRGYLHSRNGNHIEAVSDLTCAIDIDGMDPYLFFSRGVDKFEIGDNQSAADDFTEGLDLCDRHRNDYYRETLLFWRAEALLRLGKKHEALLDLARVRDDFSFWTYKLRTKADLLNDCSRLPE
jgi:tetratricopeptide (TPR) repeat protein